MMPAVLCCWNRYLKNKACGFCSVNQLNGGKTCLTLRTQILTEAIWEVFSIKKFHVSYGLWFEDGWAENLSARALKFQNFWVSFQAEIKPGFQIATSSVELVDFFLCCSSPDWLLNLFPSKALYVSALCIPVMGLSLPGEQYCLGC